MTLKGKRLPPRVAKLLIRIFARLDLASVTAWVAWLAMQRVPLGASVNEQKSAKLRILLLPKAGLLDDVANTFNGIDGVEIVTLPRRLLKTVARAFLPSEVNDNNYSSASPAAQEAMLRYRAFLTRFWRALDPKRHIDAVVSGNFAYYAEREFAAALEALGVPFVVLHKENAWTPGTQAFWGKIYRERRGRFLGRRILVYSLLERDLQVRAGIVDAPRIEVVGMPRLDEVHRWREANVGTIPKPMVLFASFPSDVGMPVLRKGTLRDGPTGLRRYAEVMNEGADSLSVTQLCLATHRAMVKLATACPDIQIVVKTKGRPRDRSDVPKWLGIEDEKNLPNNMRLVHGGGPLPLIAEAAVVCGFHSTLLLEALAAGRTVVVPWFAEIRDPDIRRHVFNLGSAVTFALSPEELIQKLESRARERVPVQRDLPVPTLSLLQEWLGNDDGRAGERTAAAICRIVEINRAERTA